MKTVIFANGRTKAGRDNAEKLRKSLFFFKMALFVAYRTEKKRCDASASMRNADLTMLYPLECNDLNP